jgi:hypothetical protein
MSGILPGVLTGLINPSKSLSELGIDYKDYPGGYEDWETVTLYQFNLEKAKLEKQNLLDNNKIKT